MAQIERIPPHSDDAERSVLGSILLDNDIFFKVSEFIDPDDFYSKANREIFTAMIDLYRRDVPIDMLTVTEELSRRKSLEACGGRSYIAELSEVPTTANAVQYARIIQEKSVYRQLISAGSAIVESSLNESFDGEKVLDDAEQIIFDIAKKKQSKDYTKIQKILDKNLELIAEAQENGGKLPGLSTGFRDLDDRTAGLQKSDFIVLAARPSMGKTAFALNIAEHAALREHKRVAFFSVEMSEESLGYRMLSTQSRVELRKLRTGNLTAEDWESVNSAVRRFEEADLLIDETPGISVMEIRNKCRRMNADRHVDLIIIDYLQILSSGSRSDSRVNEVSMMTRQLKQLAREMECPVIVLSQLSRGSVQREGDKRPLLSDLRDSGSIEQDADVVIFLHREDYFKKAEAEPNNICEVIIAKQRQGETGTVKLTWMPRFQKFADTVQESRVEEVEG
ncbi:MAG: replicative DNA helicase [Firmicutes bacterium]|nr:replicative DNA helicase [Bacillota bacterium]MBR0481415.1 replicative DNA helicase [Bacillota bacterium]